MNQESWIVPSSPEFELQSWLKSRKRLSLAGAHDPQRARYTEIGIRHRHKAVRRRPLSLAFASILMSIHLDPPRRESVEVEQLFVQKELHRTEEQLQLSVRLDQNSWRSPLQI